SLKSVFSPAKGVKEEEIQQVLQNYVLPHSNNRLQDRITQLQLHEATLQLTIKTYPEEKPYLQQLHDELADQLEKCGLQELNLHVIQQKNNLAAATPAQDSQSEKSSLPPVVDASAQVSPNTAPDNDPNNPP
ncbi:hypothetical protein ACPB4A_25160, partial [Escherichia coli]